MNVIPCSNFENSKRGQVIIKPLEAIAAYKEMLKYYAVKTIIEYFDSYPEMDFSGLCSVLDMPQKERVKDWVNFGGQIVPVFRVDELRRDIGKGRYKNWHEIHKVYDNWNVEYLLDKCRHAWAVLMYLRDPQKNADTKDVSVFKNELTEVLEIRSRIDKQIYESRAKDYQNPYKKATFRNDAEMEKVLGKPEDNPFIRIVQKESIKFAEMVARIGLKVL